MAIDTSYANNYYYMAIQAMPEGAAKQAQLQRYNALLAQQNANPPGSTPPPHGISSSPRPTQPPPPGMIYAPDGMGHWTLVPNNPIGGRVSPNLPPGSGPPIVRPTPPTGTYGNDNIGKVVGPYGGGPTGPDRPPTMIRPPYQPPVGPTGPDLPPTMIRPGLGSPAGPGWDAYAKANYKPGVNIIGLRNQYVNALRGIRPDQSISPKSYDTPMGSGPQAASGATVHYDQGGQVSTGGIMNLPSMAEIAAMTPEQKAAMAPGLLNNIRMGLRPNQYNTYLQPGSSARDMLAGTVSALGSPPQDFFNNVEQGFPSGSDPNQGITAGFKTGGRAKVTMSHKPDGSFSYSHER